MTDKHTLHHNIIYHHIIVVFFFFFHVCRLRTTSTSTTRDSFTCSLTCKRKTSISGAFDRIAPFAQNVNNILNLNLLGSIAYIAYTNNILASLTLLNTNNTLRLNTWFFKSLLLWLAKSLSTANQGRKAAERREKAKKKEKAEKKEKTEAKVLREKPFSANYLRRPEMEFSRARSVFFDVFHLSCILPLHSFSLLPACR